MMIRKLLIIIILASSIQVFGQEKIRIQEEDYYNQDVEMADQLRKDGKIYVVVTITSLVLFGLLGYAFLIDRKVTSLEKKVFNSEIGKEKKG